MCDTIVSLPIHSVTGNLILAKNSDREPNEAQAIERIPATEHAEAWVPCTYIRVPQVLHTFEVILSRPFHMWGAEMGANEHGIVIGNEAVFTKIPMPRRNTGLTGMDLLRLALERSRTAQEALNTITGLLERYGQNACGGYRNRRFFYHNSFIIADREAAWLLETAGRHWAARRVSQAASISNGLTIGADYDRISPDAIDYAYRQGWLRNNEPFNFSQAYSDWLMTRMSSCRYRQQYTEEHLAAGSKRFSVRSAMQLLSSHHLPDDRFEPHRATTADICMHATGLTNPSQTTGAMVAEIRRQGPSTVWLTGTSMPCLSVFLPFFFSNATLTGRTWNLPGPSSDDSLWWRAERLHRRLSKDYQGKKRLIEPERTAFQQQLLDEEASLVARRPGAAALETFSREALRQYDDLLHRWEDKLNSSSLKSRPRNPLYWLYQKRTDAKAGLK